MIIKNLTNQELFLEFWDTSLKLSRFVIDNHPHIQEVAMYIQQLEQERLRRQENGSL
jgi:hypothetical protein